MDQSQSAHWLLRMFFRLVTSKDKEKVPRNRTSDLRIPRSDALPLSHRDSTVSEVYYEVHMTRVLHTAGISNVDGVMFVDRNKSKLFRNLLPPILINLNTYYI